MAHAGTMLGRGTQTKQTGPLWLAIGLSVAVVVATAGAVLFASNASVVRGTAIRPADRSYDQIETQRSAVMAANETYLNGVSRDAYLSNIANRAHAQPYAGNAAASSFSSTSGTFHAGGTPTDSAEFSSTSGTFHPGGAQPVAPVKRDRIGGQ
ncbi:MAG: hypothetical protein ACJ78H_12675 [Chloroflexota bacterium]